MPVQKSVLPLIAMLKMDKDHSLLGHVDQASRCPMWKALVMRATSRYEDVSEVHSNNPESSFALIISKLSALTD